MLKKALSKRGKKEQKKKNKQIQQQSQQSQLMDQLSQQSDGQSGQQQNSQNQSDQEQDNDQQSSSQQKIDPQKLAIKQMKFRQKRGTKMNYLINRKKDEQDDQFWIDNKNYFGNLDDDDDDQESYVQSSSGRDYFDSDFDQTQSQPNQQQNENRQNVQQPNQQKEKERKRKQQLMIKIKNPPSEQKKSQDLKLSKNNAKQLSPDQIGRKYIHQVCTQQQLLGQAAHTEYFNWLSYRKLINIQTVKKDYSKKKHHIQGPKIIYRDKIMGNGQRKVVYQLDHVELNSIKDLNDIWNT